jgi:methylenetetrahydrofolate dehydrogenase (NADP+)/methenyltetrahydrofolate cyclohydrolase
MTARLLDGKRLAETLHGEVAAGADELWRRRGIQPGLAVVLVGDNSASRTYIRNKQAACARVGMASGLYELPATASQAELLALVGRLNADPAVHGILVQMPLPSQLDEAAVVRAIDPIKDVDGFGPENLGLLAAGRPRHLPCTPAGIQQLLVRNGVEIRGRHVVVVGRSTIVGKPLALLLLHHGAGADATVTVCHSRSRDLPALTRQADILVSATGCVGLIGVDHVRPGAVVVDVGMNRSPEGKLTGDVDFAAVAERAAAITPVPGGVGPMTVAMLLHNTLEAARLQSG